jgi:hypothetical protein
LMFSLAFFASCSSFFLCVCTCHSNCNYTVSKLLCFFDAQWNNIKRCCIWYSIKMFTCLCVCVCFVYVVYVPTSISCQLPYLRLLFSVDFHFYIAYYTC